MAAIRPTAASATVANWILAMTALLFFLRSAKHMLIPIALAALASGTTAYALRRDATEILKTVPTAGPSDPALDGATDLSGGSLAVSMLVILTSVADHVDRVRPIGRLMAP